MTARTCYEINKTKFLLWKNRITPAQMAFIVAMVGCAIAAILILFFV